MKKSKRMDFGQRVIKIYRDVDFMVIDGYDFDDVKDGIKMNYKPQHGTVVYIAGLVEGDDDALMCMGAPNGSTEFRAAIYPDFLEFEKGWFRLIGRKKDADKIEKMQQELRK